MEGQKQFNTVHGEQIFLDVNGVLDLRWKSISDINQIIRLETIRRFKTLSLGNAGSLGTIQIEFSERFKTLSSEDQSLSLNLSLTVPSTSSSIPRSRRSKA